jgi:FtsH-binding integral membrane protein
MSYMTEGYHSDTVAASPPNVRAAFIRRTYAHLAAAVLALIGIEAALLQTTLGDQILASIWRAGGMGWIALMVAFIGGGYLAQYLARSTNSVGTQYMGLSMYVLLEALILLPILTIATKAPQFAGKQLPLQAAVLTLVAFGALTAFVFVTKRDFSFLGPILWVATWLMLGVIVVGVLMGFSFGLVIVFAGLALAAGFILYDTSNVMHHYGPDQHVAASLNLFASVALMFYYVLRLLMSLNSNND